MSGFPFWIWCLEVNLGITAAVVFLLTFIEILLVKNCQARLVAGEADGRVDGRLVTGGGNWTMDDGSRELVTKG